MKTKLILAIGCFMMGTGLHAQTKDPMSHMDHSQMHHKPAKPASAKTTKKIPAKKVVAKKKPAPKNLKKPVSKKAPTPKTVKHSMEGMKMDHGMEDTLRSGNHAGHQMKMPATHGDTAMKQDHTMHNMNNMQGKDTSMHMDHSMTNMHVPVSPADTAKKQDHSMHGMDTIKPGSKPLDHSMHDMNGMPMMNDTMKAGSMPMAHGEMNMDGMAMDHMGTMSHAYSLNLPMNRNGSGTGWLPDAAPMYGSMIHSGNWMYMMHGSAWLRYDNQDYSQKGSRGDARFDAPNWFMFMGQRKTGKKGLFHFSTMFSLDPITEGGRGYPLLFQTGESYQGIPLVDRQHPHDLFSELAISYSHAFSKTTDAFIYVGYPGEPALGPVTFMHRSSSLDNPNSPISHHWVDATHISFGVATLGVRFGKFKLEGSSFTGREPNENRYDFDKPRFDSWSARFSFNPSANWAMQVSHGYVKSPEELHPDENIYKTTASVIYSSTMQRNGQFNITALWGMNKQEEHKGENAFLLEGAWRKNKNSLYTRYEWTQKSAEELLLEPAFSAHTIFPIHAFTLGDNFDILELGKLRAAVGGQWSIYCAPSTLNPIYGKNPMAFQLYLRIYPALMKMR